MNGPAPESVAQLLANHEAAQAVETVPGGAGVTNGEQQVHARVVSLSAPQNVPVDRRRHGLWC